jgi:hypothetical protein
MTVCLWRDKLSSRHKWPAPNNKFPWFQASVAMLMALLSYNAVSTGNPLPTFRDNVSVRSSRVKKSKKSWSSWPLMMEPVGCPETSVQNYHSMLRNIPEGGRSHLFPVHLRVGCRGSVISVLHIATRYGLGCSGLESRWLRGVFYLSQSPGRL